MMRPLSAEELRIMRIAGKAAGRILKKLHSFVKPGISTKNIELFFEQQLRNFPEMEAAFKGFMGYPASCCVSVNEEIIHGIPSGRLIEKGDLVSVDIGIKYRGLFVDAAYTYIAGRASGLAKKLVAVSCKSLEAGLSRVKTGAHLGDVGSAIQQVVEGNGFSVVRKFVGHGIGNQLHLPPEVPNFGEPGQGVLLQEGYAIAIEPMVSAGSGDVEILADGWTAITKDKSLAAHFEHTVAITNKGAWILTN